MDNFRKNSKKNTDSVQNSRFGQTDYNILIYKFIEHD